MSVIASVVRRRVVFVFEWPPARECESSNLECLEAIVESGMSTYEGGGIMAIQP